MTERERIRREEKDRGALREEKKGLQKGKRKGGGGRRGKEERKGEEGEKERAGKGKRGKREEREKEGGGMGGKKKRGREKEERGRAREGKKKREGRRKREEGKGKERKEYVRDIGNSVFGDRFSVNKDLVGQSLTGRATRGVIVFNTKVSIRTSRIVTGSQNDTT